MASGCQKQITVPTQRRMPGLEVERVHLDESGIDHFKWARRPGSTIAVVQEWLAR